MKPETAARMTDRHLGSSRLSVCRRWLARCASSRLAFFRPEFCVALNHSPFGNSGRPTKPLHLTLQEKEKLSLLARRPKSAQALALRARIVLACAQGWSNSAVAKQVHVTGATVCKWRERFRVDRL